MVIGAFRREPQIDALFGSYDDEPAEPNFLSQYRNLLHHYVHQHGREDASTFWGACGAIRRDVFLSIGGFDEGYARPSIEDIELGYRLKKAGARIRLYKSLQVKHLKRWNFASMLQADFFQRALPWTELILRERNLVNDLNTSLSGRTSVVLTFILVGLLCVSYWEPLALAGVGAAMTVLLILNAPLYRFFLRKRGFWFVIQSMFWHWLYFFYSGVAFAIGTVLHGIKPEGLRKRYSSYLADEVESAGSRHGATMMAGNTVIIGAGPAGLTAAYELSKRGLTASVLEASTQVGGLSRTENYRGYRFDIGGHRFFSKVPLINELWQEILGEEFLLRPRLSRIYYNQRFF